MPTSAFSRAVHSVGCKALFAIYVISLPGRTLKGLSDKCLCLTQAIQAVDCKFNITDAPVPDLGDVSRERERHIERLWIRFHPNPKTTLLEVCAAKDSLVQRPTNTTAQR